MQIKDRTERVDTRDKIKGLTEYIEDIDFPNLHYGRTLRSTLAHGKIVSIEYPPTCDGIWIIDGDDVPLNNDVAMIEHDMPVFAGDIVTYIGEPIALIVGKNKDQIIDYMRGIKITYDPLEPVFEMNTVKNNQAHVFTDNTYKKGNFEGLAYDDMVESTYWLDYSSWFYAVSLLCQECCQTLYRV